jgi:hypothetical protein
VEGYVTADEGGGKWRAQVLVYLVFVKSSGSSGSSTHARSRTTALRPPRTYRRDLVGKGARTGLVQPNINVVVAR